MQSKLTWKHFRTLIIQIYILKQAVDVPINMLAYVSLNGLFWIIVIFTELFVKTLSNITQDYAMPACSGVYALSAIIIVIFILPEICYISTTFEVLIERKRKQVGYAIVELIGEIRSKSIKPSVAIQKFRARKLAIVEGKALKCITIKFGWFFDLRKEFIMEYFDHILNRTFEFIMMNEVW